jgi:hypothetical protein
MAFPSTEVQLPTSRELSALLTCFMMPILALTRPVSRDYVGLKGSAKRWLHVAFKRIHTGGAAVYSIQLIGGAVVAL